MGMFDWLTGTRAAPPGVARAPAAEVRRALLAINRDTAPFLVRDGAPEGVDLVAEWKIVDARWYEIFAKAGLKRNFKILMRLDEARGEVRSVDQEWKVEWRLGVPKSSISGRWFRGQKREWSTGVGYAFREDLSYGQVYHYKFVTGEIKAPLQDAALAAGWGWRGVAFGLL